MHKRICLLLALLTLLPLASCAGDGGDETITATNNGDTTATETEATVVTDDLPDDLNYGDRDFAMYTRQRTAFHAPINVEESTGEQLNDILYERSRFVEERLGIVFVETYDTNDISPAKNMIIAGDDTYKLVTGRNIHTVQYASEGLARHLDTLQYLDLSKPYWDSFLGKNLSMAGITYTAVGSYNLTGYDFTHVLLFNKNMTEDIQLASPYDLVKEGKWTFDTFQQYGEAATVDTNGDGTFTKEDQYGFVSGTKQIPPSFWIGAGVQGIYKDKNDIPQFTMGTDEEFLDVLLHIYELIWDHGLWYVEHDLTDIPQSSIDLFSAGQSLMMDVTFFHVENFREMEADFGILPYPKYTEEQTTYYSRIEGCELPFVPSNLSEDDANMTGAVLEALASYSYQNVIPVYYDAYLKNKNTRDTESADMLDIVFANRVFDLSDTVWCEQIRDNFIRTQFDANNRSLASQIAANEEKVQASIDTIMDGFLGK